MYRHLRFEAFSEAGGPITCQPARRFAIRPALIRAVGAPCPPDFESSPLLEVGAEKSRYSASAFRRRLDGADVGDAALRARRLVEVVRDEELRARVDERAAGHRFRVERR